MPADTTDPSVQETYQAIVNNESTDWLLLNYDLELDSLALYATGRQGLGELKATVEEDIFFALLRQPFNGKNYFLFINCIPESVSGVGRARALVISRRVGAMFKARHLTLTVSKLDNLTEDVIHEALTERLEHFATVQRSSTSQSSVPADKELPDNPAEQQQETRRSTSPLQHTALPISKSTSLPAKSGMFSSFLKRKKPQSLDAGPPPPTPPKDTPHPKDISPLKPSTTLEKSHNSPPNHPFQSGLFSTPPRKDVSVETPSVSRAGAPAGHRNIPSLAQRQPTDDFVHVSRSASQPTEEEDEVVLEPFNPSSLPSSLPDRIGGPQYSKSFRRKWGQEPATHLTSAEKVKRRIEAQKRLQAEEEEAIQEEAERQARLRLKKQEMLRQEMEDEAERKRQAAEEAKQIVAERSRRAKKIREEEERKSRELAERKMMEKRRRLEETKKLEEWRQEQARRADEEASRQDVAKRAEEETRKSKIRLVEEKIKTNATEALRTGWVTVQTNMALAWKRRFFKVNGATMVFYRSPKDTHQVLDSLDLRGQVSGLKEWDQGYEELESIPYSFAVEFKDGQGSWSMFADSEEEKLRLLGLMHQAAGLKDY